ncbi:MAG: hypothetical protein K0Q53_2449 [Massilibacillus sp.]|jgi:uncharacterized protein YsxB (DUF464 family)|nr:hypothetical protein [Massilibacillus sp.]
MKIIEAKEFDVKLIDATAIAETEIRDKQKADKNHQKGYEEDIKNIGNTIGKVGQLYPILIRKLTKEEKDKSDKKTAIYGIIDGHTRFAANQKNKIYAAVVELGENEDQKKLALIANFAKSEMTMDDKAEAVYQEQERLKRLSEDNVKLGKKKISSSLETLARTFGISKGYVQKLISYHNQKMKQAKDNDNKNDGNAETRMNDFTDKYELKINDIKNSMKVIIEETDANLALDSIKEIKKFTKEIIEYLNYIEEHKPEIKAAKKRKEEIKKASKEFEHKKEKFEKLQGKIEKLQKKLNAETNKKIKDKLQKNINQKQQEYNHLKIELENLEQIINPAA